jgi:hypothetical protein
MSDRHGNSIQASRWAGGLLALGCLVLFVGALLYLPLGPILGLPSSESTYADALSSAVRLEPMMRAAGRISFVGDGLITAACIALLSRQTVATYADLERACWAVLGVGFAIAMIFDSLMGTALAPLARLPQSEVFIGFKTWFDFLFAAGNIFVIGAVGLFWTDTKSANPLLPNVVDYVFVAVSVLAVVGGFGYVLGVFVAPTLIGGTVIVLTLGLGALGVQISRRDT